MEAAADGGCVATLHLQAGEGEGEGEGEGHGQEAAQEGASGVPPARPAEAVAYRGVVRVPGVGPVPEYAKLGAGRPLSKPLRKDSRLLAPTVSALLRGKEASGSGVAGGYGGAPREAATREVALAEAKPEVQLSPLAARVLERHPALVRTRRRRNWLFGRQLTAPITTRDVPLSLFLARRWAVSAP